MPRTCQNMKDILTQVIWYNSFIKRANQMCYIDKMYNAGIVTISDIFDRSNNHCYNFDEFQLKYEATVDFVTYALILHLIPSWWRMMLKQRFIGKKNQNIPRSCRKSTKNCFILLYDSG